MQTNIKVGAVTVTYNSAAVLHDFMRSMLCQRYENLVLYVVDNASTDRTLEELNQWQSSCIKLICNGDNCGFAEGSNQGIRAALEEKCDAVLLINNDTEFDSALVETLVDGLNQYQCSVITPKILLHPAVSRDSSCGQGTIWSAGGGFNPFKGYAGFHYGVGQVDRGQFDRPRKVDHAPGCCALIRSSVFSLIGFMDERYFVYLDDSDFCFRAKAAGVKVMYQPSAVLFHKASALTGGAQSDFSVRFRTRNQTYFMLKHLGWLRNLYYLPLFQLHQLMKLITRQIDLRGLLLRESAFLDGIKVWMQSLSR
jgi:GT2 family glycosyltransferase